MSTLLTLRGIERTFAGVSGTAALRKVEIDIADGEFLAIMGPSGAGKSTLLNILGLLDAPTAGTYDIGGVASRDLNSDDRDYLRSSLFGFIFQASHVLPYETVALNVALGLSIQNVPRAERAERVGLALERVGLRHKSDVLARTLSGGERQRLAIARALATNPRVLLADEPTGNLDSANTKAIMELLAALHRSGMTIVLISHDASVSAYADRVLHLSDGVLEVAQSSDEQQPASVIEFRRPRVRSAASRLAQTFIERLADALSALTSRPARTLAVICAFVLGAGTLVAATGLGASAAQQVSDRIAAEALDEVYVYIEPATTMRIVAERIHATKSLPFVVDAGLRMNIDAAIAETARLGPTAPSSTGRFSGQTLAVDSTYLSLMGAVVSPREVATMLDRSDVGNIAIIGRLAAQELHIGATQGEEIWVMGRPFSVVGIIDNPGRLPSLDSSVLIPFQSAPALSSSMIVRTTVGYPASVAEAIPLAIDPSNPASVQVSTVGDLRGLRIGVANDLGVLVSAISIVLLVMAILSAATAMFLSVQARTQEIALRRALGLTRIGAMSMFLLEGTIVGLAGGLAGIALGLVAVIIFSIALGWTAIASWQAIVFGLAAGLIGGGISSLVPAFKAAQIQPAQAIRG